MSVPQPAHCFTAAAAEDAGGGMTARLDAGMLRPTDVIVTSKLQRRSRSFSTGRTLQQTSHKSPKRLQLLTRPQSTTTVPG